MIIDEATNLGFSLWQILHQALFATTCRTTQCPGEGFYPYRVIVRIPELWVQIFGYTQKKLQMKGTFI